MNLKERTAAIREQLAELCVELELLSRDDSLPKEAARYLDDASISVNGAWAEIGMAIRIADKPERKP